MRSVAEIDRDIAQAQLLLRTLFAERRDAIRLKNDELIAEFDAGKDIAEISQERGLPYGSVQGVLYRAGRTQSGRIAISQRLESIGASA